MLALEPVLRFQLLYLRGVEHRVRTHLRLTRTENASLRSAHTTQVRAGRKSIVNSETLRPSNAIAKSRGSANEPVDDDGRRVPPLATTPKKLSTDAERCTNPNLTHSARRRIRGFVAPDRARHRDDDSRRSGNAGCHPRAACSGWPWITRSGVSHARTAIPGDCEPKASAMLSIKDVMQLLMKP